MSIAHVKNRLANAIRPEISPIEVEAVIDDSQPYLLLPEPVAVRLELDAVCSRLIPDENCGGEICRYVGPLQMQLGDQFCYTGAVVCGSRLRIGFTVLASLIPAVKIPTVFSRD